MHSAVLLQSGDADGALDWAVKARDASLKFDDPASASIKQAEDAVARAAAASHKTLGAKINP